MPPSIRLLNQYNILLRFTIIWYLRPMENYNYNILSEVDLYKNTDKIKCVAIRII